MNQTWRIRPSFDLWKEYLRKKNLKRKHHKFDTLFKNKALLADFLHHWRSAKTQKPITTVSSTAVSAPSFVSDERQLRRARNLQAKIEKIAYANLRRKQRKICFTAWSDFAATQKIGQIAYANLRRKQQKICFTAWSDFASLSVSTQKIETIAYTNLRRKQREICFTAWSDFASLCVTLQKKRSESCIRHLFTIFSLWVENTTESRNHRVARIRQNSEATKRFSRWGFKN